MHRQDGRQEIDRRTLLAKGPIAAGSFDDETCRLEPIESPCGSKVLPMSPE